MHAERWWGGAQHERACAEDSCPNALQVAASLYAAGHAEWAVDKYAFYCVDFAFGLEQMVETDASKRFCDLLAAGVSATPSRKARGMVFSFPTYASGRRLMINIDYEKSIWSFLTPFAVEVWVLIFGAALAAGLVMLLLELEWRQGWISSCFRRWRSGSGGGGSDVEVDAGADAAGMSDDACMFSAVQTAATHATLSGGTFSLSPVSPGARIVMLGVVLTAFFLAGAYTSSYTAQIIAERMDEGITSILDVLTRTVGIFVDDYKVFQGWSLQKLVTFEWNNDEDGDAMIAALVDGTYVYALCVCACAWHRRGITLSSITLSIEHSPHHHVHCWHLLRSPTSTDAIKPCPPQGKWMRFSLMRRLSITRHPGRATS